MKTNQMKQETKVLAIQPESVKSELDKITLEKAELDAKVQSLKTELFNLRFRHATKQLANPLTMCTCKKEIARVNTALRDVKINLLNLRYRYILKDNANPLSLKSCKKDIHRIHTIVALEEKKQKDQGGKHGQES